MTNHDQESNTPLIHSYWEDLSESRGDHSQQNIGFGARLQWPMAIIRKGAERDTFMLSRYKGISGAKSSKSSQCYAPFASYTPCLLCSRDDFDTLFFDLPPCCRERRGQLWLLILNLFLWPCPKNSKCSLSTRLRLTKAIHSMYHDMSSPLDAFLYETTIFYVADKK